MRWAVSSKILADPGTANLGLATARLSVHLLAAVSALSLLCHGIGLPRVAELLAEASVYVVLVLLSLRLAPDIAIIRFVGGLGLLGLPLVIGWTDQAITPFALPWLVVLPLIGTLIDGRAMGLFFALLSALGAVTTIIGGALGGIPAGTFPPRAALVLGAGSYVSLVAVVVGVTSHYAKTRMEALERLAGAERDLARTREQALIGERLAALGTLAAGVAHEINNPMSFVAGNIESVLRSMKDARCGDAGALDVAECAEALTEAMTGASRVREIVADLTTFAHAPDETLGSVDASKLFGVVSRIVHNQLRHRARLEVTVDVGLALEASESRLAQVLVNLLTNAIQAMPERPIGENRIELSGHAAGSGRVVIEVSDNGIGMSPELLARAFEPFFTTKPVGVGTGLGLYLCRNLVLAMGGTLSITSEPGHGTRARIEVGLAKATAESSGVEASIPPPPLARRRVLIVDDEPLVSRALARMLRGRSDVTTVTSVEEALAAVESRRFDAILCDVMMPGRSGAELLYELRARGTSLADRVGFITGGAFDKQSRELLESVGDRWITKPCDTRAVESLLDRLVEGERVAAVGV